MTRRETSVQAASSEMCQLALRFNFWRQLKSDADRGKSVINEPATFAFSALPSLPSSSSSSTILLPSAVFNRSPTSNPPYSPLTNHLQRLKISRNFLSNNDPRRAFFLSSFFLFLIHQFDSIPSVEENIRSNVKYVPSIEGRRI